MKGLKIFSIVFILSFVLSLSATFAGVLTDSGGFLQYDGDRVCMLDSVTQTEVDYLSGVSSNIQTQLNGKADLSGATFTGSPYISNLAPALFFDETDETYDWRVDVSGDQMRFIRSASVLGYFDSTGKYWINNNLRVGETAGGSSQDKHGLDLKWSPSSNYDGIHYYNAWTNGNGGDLLNFSNANGIKTLIDNRGRVGILTDTLTEELNINGQAQISNVIVGESGNRINANGDTNLFLNSDGGGLYLNYDVTDPVILSNLQGKSSSDLYIKPYDSSRKVRITSDTLGATSLQIERNFLISSGYGDTWKVTPVRYGLTWQDTNGDISWSWSRPDATSSDVVVDSPPTVWQGKYWTGSASATAGMTAQTIVTGNSPLDYKWSVENNVGTELFSIGGDDYDITIRDLQGTYSGGSAYVCVYDSGKIYASETACP